MISKASLVFSIITLIIIICIIVAVVVLSKTKINELHFEQKEIPRFSVDLYFDPYPQTVNIENQYDCNVKSLRTCDINDSTTLFGCKELIVRCHHFDKDTPFIENNETTIIPKNSTSTEGYALAITTISDACNPYHGDMTLVTTDADSSEYMLICTCKNPGYIGNESILDNCTSVFICNGRIDDINKPLSEINCVCQSRQTTIRYDDGLPVCKDLLVHEANELYSDWAHIVPWSSTRQLKASNFNITISGNLKTSRLLDPCRNSIHDTSIEVPDAQFDIITRQCHINSSGFPISNEMLDFKTPNNKDPLTGITSVLATEPHQVIRFTDNIAGQRRIMGLIVGGIKFLDKYKNTPLVLNPQNGFGLGQNTGVSILHPKEKFVAPSCYGSWPRYFCDTYQERDSAMRANLPIPIGRGCPSLFLWKREEWDDTEFLFTRSINVDIDTGATISSLKLKNVDHLHTYGVQWVPQSSDYKSGLLVFRQENDYTIHKNTLTG